MQRAVAAVHGQFAGDSAETLTLLGNAVEEQALWDVLGYNTRRNNGNYVEEIITSVARLDDRVVTVVRYLLKSEKRGAHCQGEYANSTEGRWRLQQSN